MENKLFKTGLSFLFIVVLLSSCASKKKLNDMSYDKTLTEQALQQLEDKMEMLASKQRRQQAAYEYRNNNLLSKFDDMSNELQNTKEELTAIILTKSDALRDMKNKVSSKLGMAANLEVPTNLEQQSLITEVQDVVFYNHGSTKVAEEDKQKLHRLAKTLIDNPTFGLLIIGHTDKTPVVTSKFNDNWDVSYKRAKNTAAMLITMGVKPEQLSVVAKGEFSPMQAKDEATVTNDRRTEFAIITDMGKLYFDLNDPAQVPLEPVANKPAQEENSYPKPSMTSFDPNPK